MKSFFPGDKVSYIGYKLNSVLGSKLGEVVGAVLNQPNAIIVDFGDNTYICDETSLRKCKAYKESDFVRKSRHDEEN